MCKYSIVMIVLTALVPLAADRGGIPYRPNVRVFEPGQKAVIAFNGEEEILYLSTDLFASDAVKVVELVPFPSKPEVNEGEAEVLKRLQDFLSPFVRGWGYKRVDGAGRAVKEKAGLEIIEFKKIGVHNITILRVRNIRTFTDWIERRISAENLRNSPFRKRLYTVISHYIDLGFQFFVFDEIELTKAKRTVEPLEYRFRTPFPYYPLVVSSLMNGDTTITICFVTPEAEPLKKLLPATFSSLIVGGGREVGYRQTDPENFSRIWKNGASLFTSVDSAQVSLFRYRGTLQFKVDIPDVKKATKSGSCLARLLTKEAKKAHDNRNYALALELYKDVVCLRWCSEKLAEAAERRIRDITSNKKVMEQMPVEVITKDVFLKYRRGIGYALCGAKESAKRLLKSISSSTTSPTMNAKVELLQKLIDELN